jgi:anti-anti-sigma regulatory factor/HAMP domain-containing protein
MASLNKTDDTENIAKRLSELSQFAMEIAMGNLDISIPLPDEEDVFTEITTALELMRQDISRFVSEIKAEKEQVIAAQASTILELSTPTLQIWEGILALPLIGIVDTPRAQQIVDSLLEAISREQAEVAIIDITGVPVVDTKVAQHLLSTVESARMLGTEVILTGVSANNARTIVKLGVDLSGIVTKGSLKEGLRLAFDRTHNKVTKKE